MSMHDQIRLIAHELRLFGVHEHFVRRTEEAVSQSLHPTVRRLKYRTKQTASKSVKFHIT